MLLGPEYLLADPAVQTFAVRVLAVDGALHLLFVATRAWRHSLVEMLDDLARLAASGLQSGFRFLARVVEAYYEFRTRCTAAKSRYMAARRAQAIPGQTGG